RAVPAVIVRCIVASLQENCFDHWRVCRLTSAFHRLTPRHARRIRPSAAAHRFLDSFAFLFNRTCASIDHTHPASPHRSLRRATGDNTRSLAIPLVVGALIAAPSAPARGVPTPPPGPPRAAPPLRITSTFRAAVEIAPTQAVPDAAAQEKARRALYAMAAD